MKLVQTAIGDPFTGAAHARQTRDGSVRWEPIAARNEARVRAI